MKHAEEKERVYVRSANTGEMKMTGAPCKNCAERHAGCHSECEKYKEYQRIHSEEKQGIEKEKLLHNPYRLISGQTAWEYKERRRINKGIKRIKEKK